MQVVQTEIPEEGHRQIVPHFVAIIPYIHVGELND